MLSTDHSIQKQGAIACALIPARGGSVGVRNKNMRTVGGVPLIAHTLRAALAAKSIERVYVSTDSEEIADYASAQGVRVLHHPPDLSADSAPTVGVIQWDVNTLLRQGYRAPAYVVLRATTPLRTAADIDGAMELLYADEATDSVVSVSLAIGIHPIRLKRILFDGQLTDAFEEEGKSPRRRQEFEQLYVRNGGIYAFRPSVIEAGGLWGKRCIAYVMPEERSININTEFQIHLVNLLLTQENRILPSV